jgi:phage terminase Nu1 subunit (DNA packaging protein)
MTTTTNMTSTPTPNRLVTKAELAQALCVSPRTVDRWRSRGFDLGQVVTPGYPRFDLDKVRRLVEAGRLDKKKTGRSRR